LKRIIKGIKNKQVHSVRERRGAHSDQDQTKLVPIVHCTATFFSFLYRQVNMVFYFLSGSQVSTTLFSISIPFSLGCVLRCVCMVFLGSISGFDYYMEERG